MPMSQYIEMTDEEWASAMAVNCWKLARSTEKALAEISGSAAKRLGAQHRFAAGRLETLLDDRGIRIMTYEGMPFSADLPITAINADEVEPETETIVEAAIEPAVIIGGKVIQNARVIIREV